QADGVAELVIQRGELAKLLLREPDAELGQCDQGIAQQRSVVFDDVIREVHGQTRESFRGYGTTKDALIALKQLLFLLAKHGRTEAVERSAPRIGRDEFPARGEDA